MDNSGIILENEKLEKATLVKFLHIGDLHIGKIVNGFNMIEDQKFALEEILRIAEGENIDALLIAGDIYDKAVPTAEAVSLFDWFLTSLSSRDIAVFAIPGNHDSSERIAFAQGLLKEQGVHFPPVFNGNVESYPLQDEYGTVNIWLLPFLKPAHVRSHFPESDIGQDYTKALAAVLDTCNINQNERNIILSHQFVTYSGGDTIREDSELSLGGLDNVDAHVFDSFDYVALGHVHRPQRIGRETARYSGSLLKYSFSEARYPKSAVLVEVGAKKLGDAPGTCAEISLIAYPVMRDVREIKGPLSSLIENAEEIKSNDYMHVTLTDSAPQLDTISKIRAIYPNVMQLDYEFTSQATGKTITGELADDDLLDPLNLFEAFFIQQAGIEMSKDQLSIAQDALNEAFETKSSNQAGA